LEKKSSATPTTICGDRFVFQESSPTPNTEGKDKSLCEVVGSARGWNWFKKRKRKSWGGGIELVAQGWVTGQKGKKSQKHQRGGDHTIFPPTLLGSGKKYVIFQALSKDHSGPQEEKKKDRGVSKKKLSPRGGILAKGGQKRPPC